MSEAGHSGTSILLPGAKVIVFSRDKDTQQTAKSLQSDWRFARVEISVQDGDAETAIESFKTSASPDVVIIQTDTIEESFAGQLERLAGVCNEGTAAIIIGPVNDVYLYRKMVGMGVSDYLVRPVKPEIFSEVIAKTIIEKVGTTGSRMIAVVGAKGGVGATAIAQAMAWGASSLLGQKTILMDAAGGWSVLGVGMNFEPSTTLSEASRAAVNQDEDSLKRMLYPASDKLSVLASGADILLESTISPEQLEQLLDMIMVKFPVCIFDLSGASAATKNAILARAHKAVVVSTPIPSSLRTARSLLHEIKNLRGGTSDNTALIVNMQGMSIGNEVPKKGIEEALERDANLTIAFNPKLFIGTESERRGIHSDKAGLDIVKSLMGLVRDVVSLPAGSEEEEEKPDQGGIGNLLKKFSLK